MTLRALTLNPTELAGTLNAIATRNAGLTLTASGPIGTTPPPTIATLPPNTDQTPPVIITIQVGTPGTPTSPGTPGTPTQTPSPTATALPQGGFFDDVGVGDATPNNLPLFALAALGLVGVIVAARRLRVRR